MFIAFAIGGAAPRQLTAAAHAVITAVEVAAWTLAAVVMLAAAAGVTWTGVKVRAAVRAARARRAATVITLAPDRYRVVAADDDRPALAPPRRPAGSWPLPGQWDEIYPHAGDDDDRRHGS